MNSTQRHLPSLDGLRGLAIVLVVCHNVQMLDGYAATGAAKWVHHLLNLGWVGVQLFFVLSGFLITGILLDRLDHPQGLRNFWVRRALRIFPLYYGSLLLIFVLLPALGAQPAIYREEGPHQAWLWLYLYNWTAPAGIGPNALPHFWSLAVEEQFYLVWPALIYWLRSPRKVLIAALALTTFSVLCRVGLIQGLGTSPEQIYAWTVCRLDALAFGAAAAACWRMPACRAWCRQHGAWLFNACVFMTLIVGWMTHGFPRSSLLGQTLGYSALAIFFAVLIYCAAQWDHRFHAAGSGSKDLERPAALLDGSRHFD